MFDSGFGGLTVARAVIDLLPAEDLVYIGDTARYPFGPRPADEVRNFAKELATSLVADHDAKAIIVACNTAAASGLDELRNVFAVPIIDVVAPGAAALVEATTNGRAAVIGTVGTVSSGAYVHAVEHAAMVAGREVTLTSAACPGFVEFVERGQTAGDEVTVLAERLLAPVNAAGVDALLLGCTHYPFLSRVIGDVVGLTSDAGQFGRRDGVLPRRECSASSVCSATATASQDATGFSPAATSNTSASSAGGCSGQNWMPLSRGVQASTSPRKARQPSWPRREHPGDACRWQSR